MEKTDLEKLKENYSKLQKKYNLPEFSKLNEDFQIEKVSEFKTDLLMREVRKYITEKFSNYLRFVEILLHPANAPMFVFPLIKNLSTEDKQKLTEVYKKLAKYEVKMVELDLQYDEKKEAEFIITSSKEWQSIKKDILDVFKNIDKNWDKKTENNGKGYFG